ncbi:1-acylglycerol-3-phosphate O-acyltransferase [Aeromonas simiae]|uniref:1-acylglycerol-3-phosphate O-acyltransferase n=1 Tax=Aeromonas simiae TaxID=218936 RepID=UPI0005A869A9|nr:1-acylglycerol-3-phosphate O-acyltransferase [Aeromonas simiae]MDO2949469.1 1-acylglycerol-3-phosphate O-acyltransferase [Aeromonas simiae]MDO2953133.1 1-acylglycerol-3-phosphate O-acyltransferase [Aeromonas simiae]MDO2956800.1 1-acylglycerol-3-phosphate O-acyltransferase [Aeromonas simiae]
MLKLARVLLLGLLLIFWFIFGLLLCLFRPRHPNNVFVFARMYHAVCPLIGLKVKVTFPEGIDQAGPAVYVCNHQSNFDIFTVTGAVLPGVVAVGKKSLAWIPFFGLLFWLSGNVLIDRSNRSRAIGTIGQVVDRIKRRGTSIWMFPEGTRSQGRGLLPFKAGAFHTAVQAEVPVVPIICSSYFGQVDLNRWDNGEVLIEMLPPLCTKEHGAAGIRELSERCREQMERKLVELDARARRPV